MATQLRIVWLYSRPIDVYLGCSTERVGCDIATPLYTLFAETEVSQSYVTLVNETQSIVHKRWEQSLYELNYIISEQMSLSISAVS